jgi:hypothetical protein
MRSAPARINASSSMATDRVTRVHCIDHRLASRAHMVFSPAL